MTGPPRQAAHRFLLGAALSGFCVTAARIAAAIEDDLALQQAANAIAIAFAVGAAARAHRAVAAGAELTEDRGRSLARSASIAAAAMLAGALLWLRWLAASDAPGALAASACFALPFAASGYATATMLEAAGRRGLSTWLAGLATGATLALFALEKLGASSVLCESCLVLALCGLRAAHAVVPAAPALRGLSGLAFLAALLAAVLPQKLAPIPQRGAAQSELSALREAAAEAGNRLDPRGDAWDPTARAQTFELVAGRSPASGLRVLARDSGGLLPFALDDRADLAGLCGRSLLADAYRIRPRRVLLASWDPLGLRCALAAGAEQVDVAEPSAAVRSVLAAALPAQARKGADGAHVRVLATSARSLARGVRAPHYELIVLGALASAHRLAPGVLPLCEELAITDHGLFDLSRVLASGGAIYALARGEPSALRFASTAVAALRLAGKKKPENMLVVHQSGDVYGIRVQPDAFEIDDLLAYHARKNAPPAPPAPVHPLLARLLHGAEGAPELRYTPGSGFPNRFGAFFARTRAPESFEAHYFYDVAAATDDWPLFYLVSPRDRSQGFAADSDAGGLAAAWLSAGASALLLSIWLAWRGRGAHRRPLRNAITWLAFGAALPACFALARHVLALSLARPAQAFTFTALGLPAGAAFAVALAAGALHRGRWPRLIAYGSALSAFALSWLGLGPGLVGCARISSALAALAGIAGLLAFGAALGMPIAVRAEGNEPARTLDFALCALAASAMLPATPLLVLFTGYHTVAALAASLLVIAALSAGPARPAAI